MDNRENDSQREAAIGREIAYWRRERGMTRTALGAAVGVSATSIGRYERGNSSPDFTETWRIADALGVPFEDLVRRARDGYGLAANRADAEPDDETQY